MESKDKNKSKPKNSSKEEEYNLTSEEKLKIKYPAAKLHDITKNRICMSKGQLKKIFDQKDHLFNNKVLVYCEQRLIEKQGKSLDYGDIADIIDRALKARKNSIFAEYIDKNKNENRINIENDLGNDLGNDSKNDSKNDLSIINKRLDDIERRLSDIEEQLTVYLVDIKK